MKHRAAASFFALAMTGLVGVAGAADDVKHAEDERAKMLFSSGGQAYASGQYAAAIQAFTAANRATPTPAIVYSLAQAHRRQYFIDRNPEHLQKAIANFQSYVQQVPIGGRRAEAVESLSELESIVARTGGAKELGARSKEEPARLMITTQPSGARVSVDGGRWWKAPYAADVSAGKHRIHVSLDGYFDEDREVLAVDHVLVPVPVELRERPARLTVSAPKDCAIAIDGQTVGITPRPDFFEIASGVHRISVTKNGYRTFSQDIDFRRNERRALSVALRPTGQRVLARSLMIGGGALVVASGVFIVLALKQQQAALDVQEAQRSRLRLEGDDQDYRDAREARDRWRTASIAAFSVGGAALATGIVLHAFDPPAVPPPRSHPIERTPRSPGPFEPVEMSVIPVLGPTTAGFTLTGKF
ncbi:PEGA domain-containing protein [Pendulispora brunnea]|uniref:PEGA domain-containing protein n=1 Tax=Pendulispora brunnea TaxID=2905690 RepID=A0ABZ2JUX0_9BACT